MEQLSFSIDAAGNFQTHDDITQYGGASTTSLFPLTLDTIYPTTWYPHYYGYSKSAREQVQDQILTKMAEAIEKNDLAKAKKLVELAKALKEL